MMGRALGIAAPLPERRRGIEGHWERFRHGACPEPGTFLRPEIASSWQRSAARPVACPKLAPSEDHALVAQVWRDSALRTAVERRKGDIAALAAEAGMLAAVADPCGRLLWSQASRPMRRRAESINFTTGGRWDEPSVGTNAVGLALELRAPVTVFSAEHYQPCVHDWVCYAAPILHPRSGTCVGVLDLSTTWNRHTPLGQAAVTELARGIAAELPEEAPRAELELRVLGEPQVWFRGKRLRLTPRQQEILALLALHPQGLTLEALHAALYGDARVSLATLKSELSHLRRQLDGRIESRPYRLSLSVWADFVAVWQALRRDCGEEALALYRGPLLPRSESPELCEWRHCIDAVMERALRACRDTGVLLERLCQGGGSALLRERLAELVG
jgi:transcriptional regulator of acetoin/glycerol metabolism